LQGDVELVRAVFEAWNSGDLDRFTDLLSEDIEWHEIGGRPEREQTRGRGTLRAGLESLFETWEYYRLEPEEILDAEDRVVAVLREVARGRASGLEIEGLWGYVITVQGGKVVRVEAYRDPRQALSAAGLD
jgi:ketosteroid isomerase-like protein